MRILNNLDFLDLWESGSRRHPLDRALLALGAAFPESSFESIAAWPVGRRNKALIQLHCSWFGPKIPGVIPCRRCGEKLEIDLDGRIMAEIGHDAAGVSDETIDFNGQTFRLPNTRDLACIVRETDPQRAAILLLERCRMETSGTIAWSDGDLAEIGERMARADPLAEIQVSLRCPDCGNEWEEAFDVVAFLWADISALVRRLVSETHVLASAYGWSEGEIMSMSESRRALYLEMAQS